MSHHRGVDCLLWRFSDIYVVSSRTEVMVCLDFFFCQKSVFVNEKLSLIGHAFKLTVDDVELSIWQDERISVSDTTLTFYFKLHYIGPFFVVDIKLVFSSFKIVNKLVWKTLSLVGLVRVWFTSFYVGETPQHLLTRVHQHLVSNGTSHIFRHLQNSQLCRTLCSDECFGILDHASTTF